MITLLSPTAAVYINTQWDDTQCCCSHILTLIKCLALFRSPSVVCLELSAPTGTMSFSFSRQWRRWARRFFSSSLWVDLKVKVEKMDFTYCKWYYNNHSFTHVIYLFVNGLLYKAVHTQLYRLCSLNVAPNVCPLAIMYNHNISIYIFDIFCRFKAMSLLVAYNFSS